MAESDESFTGRVAAQVSVKIALVDRLADFGEVGDDAVDDSFVN